MGKGKTVLNVHCVEFCHGGKGLPRVANAKLDNKQCKLLYIYIYIDENPFTIRLLVLGTAKSIVNIEPWTNHKKEKAKVKKKKKRERETFDW